MCLETIRQSANYPQQFRTVDRQRAFKLGLSYLQQTHDWTPQYQPYQQSCISLWCSSHADVHPLSHADVHLLHWIISVTIVTSRVRIVRDVTPCRWVRDCWRFEGKNCPHLQSAHNSIRTWLLETEDGGIISFETSATTHPTPRILGKTAVRTSNLALGSVSEV